jgi:hypothetical protein
VEKVLLNDVAEIAGVAPDVVELDVVELDVAGVLDAVVELLVDGGVAAVDLLCEFELPHAATASAAVTVRAAVIALPFSKCTIDLLYGALCDTEPRAGMHADHRVTGLSVATRYDRHHEQGVNIATQDVNVA